MRSWGDDDLMAAVESSTSIAAVCRALGIRAAGGNRRSVSRVPELRGDAGDALREATPRFPAGAVAAELGVSDNAVRKWFRSAGEEPPRRDVRRRGA